MTFEETLESISVCLSNDQADHNIKIQAVQNLKAIFKTPDKMFSKLNLSSLLENVDVPLRSKPPDKYFLYQYGLSLVNFIRKDMSVKSYIHSQLEYVLQELSKLDNDLTNSLFQRLWNEIEQSNLSSDFSEILSASKRFLESAVLNWVENIKDAQIQFYSNMAANSSLLFQKLTSILYEILVNSKGHQKVFGVTEKFVGSVKNVCQREGKNFLGLYPKGFSRIVSFLIVPPDLYIEGGEDIIEKVLSLLLDLYLTERSKALILLTHYSCWMNYFMKYFTSYSITES